MSERWFIRSSGQGHGRCRNGRCRGGGEAARAGKQLRCLTLDGSRSGRDERCVLGALDVADVVRLQGGEALADGEQVLVADLRVDGAERARRVLDGTGIRRAVLHLDLEGSRDVRALRSHDSSPFR